MYYITKIEKYIKYYNRIEEAYLVNEILDNGLSITKGYFAYKEDAVKYLTELENEYYKGVE